MDRLRRKYETARTRMPAPVVDEDPGAEIGIIAFGSTHWSIIESRDQLREETDVKTSYFRVRGFPFNDDLTAFIDAHDRLYVVEQNRDGQMLQLMKLDLTPERVAKLHSVLHYDGLPLDARTITDSVLAQEGYQAARKHTEKVSGGSMTRGE